MNWPLAAALLAVAAGCRRRTRPRLLRALRPCAACAATTTAIVRPSSWTCLDCFTTYRPEIIR
jgi:hypothetical protein